MMQPRRSRRRAGCKRGRAPTRDSRRCRPTAARSRRARSSSRCAASASTATTTSAAARESGAAAAMVERVGGIAAAGLPLIVVGDTRLALGRLAQHWRDRFRIPAWSSIVGSNGKTTVKEMLASGSARALRRAPGARDARQPEQRRRPAAHALASRARSTRCAVLEIGMNHPGEIGHLAGIAGPDVALVNNAQREHLEFMQSVEEVAAENAAVLRALPDDGIAVLNRDDAHYDVLGRPRGQAPPCDRSAPMPGRACGATIGSRRPRARSRSQADGARGGRHAAVAGGAQRAQRARRGRGLRSRRGRACTRSHAACGVPRGEGPAPVQARPQRAYSSSTTPTTPTPTRCARRSTCSRRSERPRVLILGDMGEVGAQGRGVPPRGRPLRQGARRRRLLAVGPLGRAAARAFGAGGEHFESVEAVIARAQGLTALKGPCS